MRFPSAFLGGRRGPQDLAAVSALDEPTRRRLYEFVCSSAEPVSRDDAAEALGIARKSVAFHLDKLAEAGLLDTGFGRRGLRRGPGAGRPAKLYRRADRSFTVQLPDRSYALAGHLFAQAIDDAAQSGTSPRSALARNATELGEQIGATAGRSTDELIAALERCGYEPRLDDGTIILANCPFHELAEEHTELVCAMNLDLVTGVLRGSGCTGCARSRPHDRYCCVAITPD